MQRWGSGLEFWVTAAETSLYREAGLHLQGNLVQFLRGDAMFPVGVQVPLGVAVQYRQPVVREAAKWQHLIFGCEQS